MTTTVCYAITQTDKKDPFSFEWREAPKPTPQEGEALVRVHFAGVNRADTLQAAGHYPPPKNVTDTLGLEASGVIENPNGVLKPDGTPWVAGEKVAVLLSGGGYAQHVTVPQGQIMPIPNGFTLAEAASIVEVANTVWSNVMMTASIKPGDLVLFHGGGGGIGLFGIQLAKALGARVAVTAGSAEKLNICKQYGADILINYKEEDFTDIIHKEGGANVILDIIGAKYLNANIKALAPDGHILIIGMQGGVKGELNIGRLLAKRGTISATGLRYRNHQDKARIVAETLKTVWPLLEQGKIRPHIDRMLPIAQATAAHKALLNGEVTGKIVLKVPH